VDLAVGNLDEVVVHGPNSAWGFALVVIPARNPSRAPAVVKGIFVNEERNFRKPIAVNVENATGVIAGVFLEGGEQLGSRVGDSVAGTARRGYMSPACEKTRFSESSYGETPAGRATLRTGELRARADATLRPGRPDPERPPPGLARPLAWAEPHSRGPRILGISGTGAGWTSCSPGNL
jgi:hypothetical protein